MRFNTLDELAQITRNMFDTYVEYIGLSQMSGDVPTVICGIHRTGSKEYDWLSSVKINNTTAVSVFRCDVYLDDVFRLCRKCKMYLVTENVFRIAVLYSMLHPLYQTKYINFRTDVDADYDSMMASAGKETYHFIHDHVAYMDEEEEELVLEILRYHMMIFTNHYFGNADEGDYGRTYKKLQDKYARLMIYKYPGAFHSARARKAQTYLIDSDGYLRLERITAGSTTHIRADKR